MLVASRINPTTVLKDAASVYKVDTEAIAAKVKKEFATKEKVRTETKTSPKEGAKATGKVPSKAAA